MHTKCEEESKILTGSTAGRVAMGLERLTA